MRNDLLRNMVLSAVIVGMLGGGLCAAEPAKAGAGAVPSPAAVMQKMGRAMNCTIFVVNGPSTAGLAPPAVGSFSIAGPTGEGVVTPLTFTRQRRAAVIGGMRFL